MLNKAITKLDIVKFFTQLAWEIKLIPTDKYSQLISGLEEIGRQLGGWKKACKRKLLPKQKKDNSFERTPDCHRSTCSGSRRSSRSRSNRRRSSSRSRYEAHQRCRTWDHLHHRPPNHDRLNCIRDIEVPQSHVPILFLFLRRLFPLSRETYPARLSGKIS